jgi:putative SOS response-associated peptidase YedK
MRCLMPARGWYEWNENEQVRNEGGRKVKQPYFISAAGLEVIVFAGLWATWQAPDGSQVLSCALMSKTAAPSIAHIHDRMPVVLKPEHFASWLLDPKTQRQDVQESLSAALSDFVGYPVDTKVNSTRNHFPELLEPTSTSQNI